MGGRGVAGREKEREGMGGIQRERNTEDGGEGEEREGGEEGWREKRETVKGGGAAERSGETAWGGWEGRSRVGREGGGERISW